MPRVRSLPFTLVLAATVAGAAAAQAPPPIEMAPAEALAWLEAQPAQSVPAGAREDIAFLIGPAHPLAVFAADVATTSVRGGAEPGRWTPTQAQAEEAWSALADYTRAHGVLKAYSSVQLAVGPPGRYAKACAGLRGFYVQAAGVAAPGAAAASRIALNLVPVGWRLTAGERWRRDWMIWADGPAHPKATYDLASKQIVAFDVASQGRTAVAGTGTPEDTCP